MKIGVIKTSLKENEKRIPIYPEHIKNLKRELFEKLIFEVDYGIDYGFSNDQLKSLGCKLEERDSVFSKSDILLLPKPTENDFKQMHEGQVLWGWSHCVQQNQIAQYSIDKKLTLIAWEAMHVWGENGDRLFHCFYKNNEIAGYASVLHALELMGIDGLYGQRRKVVVIGYGSVSKGAILALRGRGFNNIHTFTRRQTHLVGDQNPDVYYQNLRFENDVLICSGIDGVAIPFIDILSDSDIIINGVLQNTDNPLMYIDKYQIDRLKNRSLIIDISCDEGMGFPFARPTSFQNPTFKVANDVTYYSVDHTPSYLWNSASRELSKIVIAYLPIIIGGKEKWLENPTIRKSIEILNGNVVNKKILTFQNRDSEYPYFYKHIPKAF